MTWMLCGLPGAATIPLCLFWSSSDSARHPNISPLCFSIINAWKPFPPMPPCRVPCLLFLVSPTPPSAAHQIPLTKDIGCGSAAQMLVLRCMSLASRGLWTRRLTKTHILFFYGLVVDEVPLFYPMGIDRCAPLVTSRPLRPSAQCRSLLRPMVG